MQNMRKNNGNNFRHNLSKFFSLMVNPKISSLESFNCFSCSCLEPNRRISLVTIPSRRFPLPVLSLCCKSIVKYLILYFAKILLVKQYCKNKIFKSFLKKFFKALKSHMMSKHITNKIFCYL